MKTTILFASFICCLSLQIKAQTSGNNTVVNDNTAWAVLRYIVAPTPYLGVNTEYIYLEGDSIIAGHSYKKIYSCNDSLHQNITYKGLIREYDKKTYYTPSYTGEREYLLYDFSLEEGMSIEYQNPSGEPYPMSFYVKTVDSVNINDVQRKRIQLTFTFDDESIRDTWVEGIGSLKGLFYPFTMLIPGSITELLCYFQDNELIYKNPEYSKCYYDRAEDISVPSIANKEIHIYPNLIENQYISFSSGEKIFHVEIFDISGKRIYSQLHGNTIDVSWFAKGLYIIKVCNLNKQVSVFKIIKQ